MSKTNISWTDYSWNPYRWRCRKISPGCKNCYMMALARRMKQDPTAPLETRWPKAEAELRRMEPGSTIFVNSMSDTYYQQAADADVHRVHNTALAHPDKTFLVLTKRPERPWYMRHLLAWPDNLWLGVSVENMAYLWRIDMALKTPAKHVFVSAEPLLGSLNEIEPFLKKRIIRNGNRAHLAKRVEWVIVGGESGKGRRKFSKEWARDIRDLCFMNHVAFFFKQGSAFKPGQDDRLDSHTWKAFPQDIIARKKRYQGDDIKESGNRGYTPPARNGQRRVVISFETGYRQGRVHKFGSLLRRLPSGDLEVRLDQPLNIDLDARTRAEVVRVREHLVSFLGPAP